MSKPEPELAGTPEAVEPKLDILSGNAEPVTPEPENPPEPAPQATGQAPEPEAAEVPATAKPKPAAVEPGPKVAAVAAEPDPKIVGTAPEPEPEPVPAPEPEPAAPPVGDAEPAPKPQDLNKSLEARIAVLETLRLETETFQETLTEAIAKADSEAESGRIAKKKLAEAESRLEKLTKGRAELIEAAQNDRARLHAVRQEARDLKEQVVELKTRLARANAQIESSVSVISELESASRMAIELNADYRAQTQDSSSENRALRSRIGLLEAALAERDDLLQSTNQTNEEISRALLDERGERASIEEDFNALSKDFEALQQSSTVSVKRADIQADQSARELETAQQTIASLEEELERTHSEHKQMQLDHHARQTENARLRVDHGVHTRLLENNLQELSAHVAVLEQQLRDNGLAVPALELTPVDRPAAEPEAQPEPARAAAATPAEPRQNGDVVNFRAKR